MAQYPIVTFPYIIRSSKTILLFKEKIFLIILFWFTYQINNQIINSSINLYLRLSLIINEMSFHKLKIGQRK